MYSRLGDSLLTNGMLQKRCLWLDHYKASFPLACSLTESLRSQVPCHDTLVTTLLLTIKFHYLSSIISRFCHHYCYQLSNSIHCCLLMMLYCSHQHVPYLLSNCPKDQCGWLGFLALLQHIHFSELFDSFVHVYEKSIYLPDQHGSAVER